MSSVEALDSSSSEPSSLEPVSLESIQDEVMTGNAVQIVAIDESDHSFILDESALNRILKNERIKDKPISVVSVAGAFRRGKSFLLDFLLRYLRAGGKEGWIGKDDQELEGFHWRGGADRDTTGILLWSEVFLVKNKSGKEVAVVLMDTQGAFDSNSTVRDCATIFALSAMLSSVLIYNLTSNIQEDDLQHLQLFTEYGRLALEDSGETPFQKLQFLVRDWSYPYEAEYGKVGGQKILDKRLEVSEKQHPELQALRKHISSCFKTIEGFLLPHPGLNVATNPNFKGQLKDIEPAFRQHLEDFIPMNLSSENITLKRIGGDVVTCQDLVEFFKAYIEIFKGDEMPEPKSMLEATSEANNLASLSAAKDAYVQLMESVCGGEKPYIHESILETEHYKNKDQAMTVFGSRRKMGGEEFSAKYKEQLEKEIEDSYVNYKAHNESKNIFKAANTPITLASIACILYILSNILSLIGLYPIANFLHMFVITSFLVLGAWGYVKYSGNMPELGIFIEDKTAFVWDEVLHPTINLIVARGADMAARQAVQRMNSTTTPPNSSGLRRPKRD